jgi:hypothetical protein
VPPPVYDHRGITIVSKEIKLGPTDGKLWIQAVIANHTSKELTIDLNQIFAQRLDGCAHRRGQTRRDLAGDEKASRSSGRMSSIRSSPRSWVSAW